MGMFMDAMRQKRRRRTCFSGSEWFYHTASHDMANRHGAMEKEVEKNLEKRRTERVAFSDFHDLKLNYWKSVEEQPLTYDKALDSALAFIRQN